MLDDRKPLGRLAASCLIAFVATLLAIGCAETPTSPADVAAQEGWERVEDGALLIDVRSAAEYEGGGIPGAINIPHSDTQALADAIGDDRDRAVVMYCGSGRRVGFAIEALGELGYTNLFNATGYEALRKAMSR